MFIRFHGYDYAAGGICAPKGFSASAARCGIGPDASRDDLALIHCDVPCRSAAVFSCNALGSASAELTRSALSDGFLQSVLCVSGSAMIPTKNDLKTAGQLCEAVSRSLGTKPGNVGLSSFGTTVSPFPFDLVKGKIGDLAKGLSTGGSEPASLAVLGSDRSPKETAVSFTLDDRICKLGGIAKGTSVPGTDAGTLICILTTDAAIERSWLERALRRVWERTFGLIDRGLSSAPGDLALVMASGLAENPLVRKENADYLTFENALYAVMMNLARGIAEDGEGDGKLFECTVSGAADDASAREAALALVSSLTLKETIVQARPDPSLAAALLGSVGIPVPDPDIALMSAAGALPLKEGLPSGQEELIRKILSEEEIKLLIDLDMGRGSATAWSRI